MRVPKQPLIEYKVSTYLCDSWFVETTDVRLGVFLYVVVDCFAANHTVHQWL